MSIRTITIGEAMVVFAGHFTNTHFHDGTMVRACPEPTEDYRRTARELLYGEDVERLCRGHELSHSLFAAARGLPVSPVLWAVAHDLPETSEHYAEEDEVMAFQRFCNGGPRPAGAEDWEGMRDRLREVAG